MDRTGSPLPPKRLLLALATQRLQAARLDVVSALRTVVETVVLPALLPELQWTSVLITPDDDLESGAPPARREGRDWGYLEERVSDAESIWLEGHLPTAPTLPPDPRWSPVHLLVRLPPARAGELTVTLSVHEWALRDVDREAHLQASARWLPSAAEALGASTGYISLDHADAWDGASSWELATAVSPSVRDFDATIWGYGWCTLLSAAHAAAVGGVERLRTVPGAQLLVGPHGQVWVRLGDDPASVSATQVASLREVLSPVLPRGRRTLTDFFAAPTNPYEVPALPYLL